MDCSPLLTIADLADRTQTDAATISHQSPSDLLGGHEDRLTRRTEATGALSPKCLLETAGRRCGCSVAFRGLGRGRSRSACRLGFLAWLSIEERPVGVSPRCGSKEERARPTGSRSARRGPTHLDLGGGLLAVITGVDPHKATHTAVAISGGEQEVARKTVGSGGRQAEHLWAWADPFEMRTWAIESAGGLGYLLAQQFVAAGETVIDVPATLASRVRILATGRSNMRPRGVSWMVTVDEGDEFVERLGRHLTGNFVLRQSLCCYIRRGSGPVRETERCWTPSPLRGWESSAPS
jgi:hypothetical protein